MSSKVIESNFVKQLAHQQGFDLAGICRPDEPDHYPQYLQWLNRGQIGQMEYLRKHADIKSNPENLLSGVKSILAVGLNYYQTPTRTPTEPRIARYALGRDYHQVIRSKLRKLDRELKCLAPNASTRICVDSAPLMERDFAQKAGLGWFGKNTMIINSRRGSWFLLGFLLMDLELDPDPPAVGGCGTCRKCIDACPTGAITLQGEVPSLIANRCLSYLTIEHKGEIPLDLERAMGDWTFGCDICQEVCPFNQPNESQPMRARTTTEPDFLNRREFGTLQELAELSQDKWENLTPGSPVRRTGIDGICRNAAINLKNLSS